MDRASNSTRRWWPVMSRSGTVTGILSLDAGYKAVSSQLSALSYQLNFVESRELTAESRQLAAFRLLRRLWWRVVLLTVLLVLVAAAAEEPPPEAAFAAGLLFRRFDAVDGGPCRPRGHSRASRSGWRRWRSSRRAGMSGRGRVLSAEVVRDL